MDHEETEKLLDLSRGLQEKYELLSETLGVTAKLYSSILQLCEGKTGTYEQMYTKCLGNKIACLAQSIMAADTARSFGQVVKVLENRGPNEELY